jgi:hypothetical protein
MQMERGCALCYRPMIQTLLQREHKAGAQVFRSVHHPLVWSRIRTWPRKEAGHHGVMSWILGTVEALGDASASLQGHVLESHVTDGSETPASQVPLRHTKVGGVQSYYPTNIWSVTERWIKEVSVRGGPDLA